MARILRTPVAKRRTVTLSSPPFSSLYRPGRPSSLTTLAQRLATGDSRQAVTGPLRCHWLSRPPPPLNLRVLKALRDSERAARELPCRPLCMLSPALQCALSRSEARARPPRPPSPELPGPMFPIEHSASLALDRAPELASPPNPVPFGTPPAVSLLWIHAQSPPRLILTVRDREGTTASRPALGACCHR